jgi:hypothetical protein
VSATTDRLAAALNALGVAAGAHGAADRSSEIALRGGPDAYRAWLASALLGAAQAEAMVADAAPLTRSARQALWEQQLSAAGASEDAAGRIALIVWQMRRASAPLPAIAHDSGIDPIPLAAAQAAEGLQGLLAVAAASRGAVAAGDVETLAAQVPKLREARKVLQAAIGNTDALLEMLGSVGL